MDPLSASVGLVAVVLATLWSGFYLGTLPGKARAAEHRAEEAMERADAFAAAMRLSLESAERRAELETLLVDSGGDDSVLAERVLQLVLERELAASATEPREESPFD